MPTLRGWVFAIVHTLLLALGLLRDELGIVVFAGGMLAVEAAVVSAALLGGFRLRAFAGRFAADIATPLVETGRPVRVELSAPPVGLLPGFLLEHELRLSWSGGRRLSAASAVPAGERCAWELPAPERGDYRADGSALVLRDLFGMTASRIVDRRPLRLIVLPAPAPLRPDLPARRGGDRVAERSPHRIRSDELREVRPYVPGDDTRRLSWKHLAVHRELLVRVGEQVPPTRGEVHCRVHPEVPVGADPLAVGDALMEAVRAAAGEAERRGLLLTIELPGTATFVLPPRLGEPDPSRDAADDPAVLAAAAALAGFTAGADRTRDLRSTAGRDGTRAARSATPRAARTGEIVVTATPATGAHVVSVAELVTGQRTQKGRRFRWFFREVS